MNAPVSYNVPTAAEVTGVSARTIDRACKAKDAAKIGVPLLRSKMIGGRRVILASDLHAWAKELPDG